MLTVYFLSLIFLLTRLGEYFFCRDSEARRRQHGVNGERERNIRDRERKYEDVSGLHALEPEHHGDDHQQVGRHGQKD